MLEAEQEEHSGVSKQQVTSLGGTAKAWLPSSAGGITGAGNPMGRAELRHPSPALLGAPGAGTGCRSLQSCPKEGGSRTAGTCWLRGHARLNIFMLGRNIFPLETPAWLLQRVPRGRAPVPGQPGPGHARDSPWAPWGLWGGGCGSAGWQVTHGSAKGMPASSLPLQAWPCFVVLGVLAGVVEEKGRPVGHWELWGYSSKRGSRGAHGTEGGHGDTRQCEGQGTASYDVQGTRPQTISAQILPRTCLGLPRHQVCPCPCCSGSPKSSPPASFPGCEVTGDTEHPSPDTAPNQHLSVSADGPTSHPAVPLPQVICHQDGKKHLKQAAPALRPQVGQGEG